MRKLNIFLNFLLISISSVLVFSEKISLDDVRIDGNLLKTSLIENLEALDNTIVKSKIDTLSGTFKRTLNKIKNKNKKIDVVFLIDSSSSVGKNNFMSELKFVKKLLSDFNVSYNNTRVSVITFSSQGKVIRHIDQISSPNIENDKCRLLYHELPQIQFYGGGTYTYGALKKARETLNAGRQDTKKVVFLITDGFSNGRDPVPMAQQLKKDHVTIFTFGIQTGNYEALNTISSPPHENHNYLLDSFIQFESLARKALHSDYKLGSSLRVGDQSLCDILCDARSKNESLSACCDERSECVCGTTSGQYSCMCNPGYYGSGLKGSCELCPNGTYWQSWNLCRPCPDINHITIKSPATSGADCVCKTGFKISETNRCEVITCPRLQPPDNGYFVKHPTGCGHVLNAACGARCQSGYQLTGSSIRLCQENGTWSGNEISCVLKTCPSLPIPFYGLAICKNSDLNAEFDYSFRNQTFADAYYDDSLRVTEPMPIDTDCTFKCGPGFYLVGSANRNCLPLSKWDGLQTACKQILCSALPSIPFGQYDPTDCDDQKQSHGTNCSLICDPGFEAKGPASKHCGGKRNGIWTHKLKTPKCVDVTPPELECPSNYDIPLEESEEFALILELQPPNITDNSNMNTTFWSKPAIKEGGIRLPLGSHNFTYVAVDTFKNRARCNFTVTVVDRTPPVLENCNNPLKFKINPRTENKSVNFIEWEDPIIYDNSNLKLTIVQSHEPGYLGIGIHEVIYTATDTFNNTNSCQMNITVEELKCDILPSPQHGQTICAQNGTHMWCEVVCKFGYGFHFGEDDDENADHLENMNLVCEHDHPKWNFDPLPECTQINLPDTVEEVFSIVVDSEESLCGNHGLMEDLQKQLKEHVREQMCGGQIADDCEIVSEIPFCEDGAVIENDDEKPMESPTNKTFYSLVKREINEIKMRKYDRTKTQLRVNVFTKISKELGYWNNSISKSENIRIMKNELRNVDHNAKLKNQLKSINVNLSNIKRNVAARCRDGSILKRNYCVQCPAGSYHNRTLNMCKPCPIATYNNLSGQKECLKCPPNYSTKKPNSKSLEYCREQCRPGTMARLKSPKRNRFNLTIQKSLMPYCRKCPPGEYQPYYDQTFCEKCPHGFTSMRGARHQQDCYANKNPCAYDQMLCGQHGVCITEPHSPYLYSCLCSDGWIGSHCERKFDLCASSPCINGGTCRQTNNTLACECPRAYGGEFCERMYDVCDYMRCENDGQCVMLDDGSAICECEIGYSGLLCETPDDYCVNSPCENGECQSTPGGYYCKCFPGYLGRRCHLRPCDYIPCPANSICVDLLEEHTRRNSYACKCPRGFRGPSCQEIDNPCDYRPCRNNGYCRPRALRHPAEDSHFTDAEDDAKYEQYTCECPPYFYGNQCQTFIIPDYVLNFENSGINDYVQIDGPTNNLTEISFCVWLQTNDTVNYGVILSYATTNSDNMFTLTDYNGFVLYVNGDHIITDIKINDGLWHFICVSWQSERGIYEIYLDGNLHSSGMDLATNAVISANGSLTIGQEQDEVGSDFSETESYIGKLAYLDIWNHTLTQPSVSDLYMSCEPYLGNLIPWTDFKANIHGNIQVMPSPFCQTCPMEIVVKHGHAQVTDNKAYYVCDEGYQLHGTPVRKCLRTSQWALPEPTCEPVTCGGVHPPLNGYVRKIQGVRGDEAVFTCRDGFYLDGPPVRLCLANGSWSDTNPECFSKIHCSPIDPPVNSFIIYATEKGPLRKILMNYPVGTLAEIECPQNMVLEGENLLTCLDNGVWDSSIPSCRDIETTTLVSFDDKYLITETTTTIEEIGTTEIPYDYGPILDKVNSMDYPIDITFLRNLHGFYFMGCMNKSNPDLSVFCHETNIPRKYEDLTNFNHNPDADYLQDVDQKWLKLFQLSVDLLSNNETEFRRFLNVENLFEFLVYENYNIGIYTRPVENTYRLYFCFYIDSLILENKLKHFKFVDKSNLEKNQLMLAYLIFPMYEEYALKYENVNKTNTTPMEETATTITTTEITNLHFTIPPTVPQKTIQCDLLDVLNNSPNISYFNVSPIGKGQRKTLNFSDLNSVERYPVNVGDHVFFACDKGMENENGNFSVCTESGEWSNPKIMCVNELYCGHPPKPITMTIVTNGKHKIGEKVELKCNPGFTIHGNSKIECLSDQKWSKILARCSKISCNKPKIPARATILSGRSYLFKDKLLIQCPNKKLVNIECSSEGQWIPIVEC